MTAMGYHDPARLAAEVEQRAILESVRHWERTGIRNFPTRTLAAEHDAEKHPESFFDSLAASLSDLSRAELHAGDKAATRRRRRVEAACSGDKATGCGTPRGLQAQYASTQAIQLQTRQDPSNARFVLTGLAFDVQGGLKPAMITAVHVGTPAGYHGTVRVYVCDGSYTAASGEATKWKAVSLDVKLAEGRAGRVKLSVPIEVGGERYHTRGIYLFCPTGVIACAAAEGSSVVECRDTRLSIMAGDSHRSRHLANYHTDRDRALAGAVEYQPVEYDM